MKNHRQMKKTLFKFLMLFGMLVFAHGIQAQNTVRGTVNDPAEGEGLIGANILIKGTSIGTTTDIDGNFTLTSAEPLPWTLEVSYTGYSTQEVVVATNNSSITVDLAEGVIFGDDIVISASRKREKVQEAPASISVVGTRQLETSANTDPTRNLVNTPGVSITQQSAGRINIEMRAGVGLFGTSAFPIMDYRSLVGPGIGTFQSDGSGINNVDLARVEVVRGPASALYGPGVTSGVVHFITKSPIDEPCTTVQAAYGNMNTVNAAIRHAGANDEGTFGYKIVGNFNRGDEFTLDGSEGTTDGVGVFTRQVDKFLPFVNEPNTEAGFISGAGTEIFSQQDLRDDGTLLEDGTWNLMQNFYENKSLSGHLEFRPADDLNVTVSGGYNNASAVFYNDLGEGRAYANEFWGQARMQKGGLFAQVFYVDNDGGPDDNPTFLYQTGNNAGIARKQLEGQVQYNFQTPSLLDADWTVGIDYRQAITDTGRRTYGREEDNDDYGIIGGYAQGKFALGKKLDLLLAARYDSFNFLDDSFLSPRVAFVFKPSPKHTFRATFNRAGAPPTGIQMAIDFPVNVPVPGVFDIWLAGMNNQHTFPDNPNIEFLNQSVVAQGIAAALGDPSLLPTLLALGDALPDQLPAGTLGVDGLSNAFVHGVATQSILAALAADPNTAPFVDPVSAYLQSVTPGGNVGTFFGVNLFEANAPLNQLIDTNGPEISVNNTYELGYKGLIGNKLGVMVDLYHVQRTGFDDFTAIAPLISLVGQDLTALNGVATDFGAWLVSIGVPAAQATQLAGAYGQVANLVPNYYNTGTVETSQMPQNDGIMHVAAGYRIFPDAKLSYTGVDLGLEYYFTDDLSGWFNYSYISQNEFSGEELGVDADSPLAVSLNTAKNKFRAGLILAPQTGFRGSLSFQHDDSFLANTGQYAGQTDERNLLDASIGYKFDNGLAIDLSGNNIFDNKYRAFPNMPQIGRLVRAKVTYTFGCKNANPSLAGVTGNKDMDSDGDGIKDSKDKCPNIAGVRKYKGCPMSDADMAAKAAEEARLAAEAKTRMEMEAKARAEEESRLAKIAADKAAAEAKERAEAEAKMAAEAAAKAAADAAAKAAADAKAAAASTEHSHPGIGTHSHANSGAHTHVGAAGGTTTANTTRDSEVAAVFDGALTGIQFNTGQNTFTSSSYNVMAQVVNVMNRYPNMKVTIEGHTDSVGSREPNRALSQRRADAVKAYLISKGISSSRLTAIGYGEARPIADNMTNEGRSQNRRVAFVPSYN